jgi:gliding motility-associated protein GldM
MAGGNLSPRQKMINMMYLVLTALLALNVSKEVLNSFFEVNKGITRTTTNFNAKNGDTYAAFDAAAEVNPVKAGPYREQAYQIKDEADKLIASLQEMKYNLVLAADKIVYLGYDSEIKDEEGDLIEEKAIELSWDLLSDQQKLMNIGALTNKDDRHAAGDLFYSSKRKKNIATDLKTDLISYKNLLLSIADGNESLLISINETSNYDDKKVKGKKQLWEEYNFYDMPSVGALTLLSKMQSDVRNTEADIINMLRKNIDAGSLKFTSAEGIQIPNSNFVLKGDSFRAQIFIAAKDTTQAPIIYVGEFDSLGGGIYEMIGNDYETVKVVNGKGIFARRASSEGNQKWGGLISMKTDNGIKMYPFRGQYLVAAKTAVVSPTNMNILYLEVDNPLKISVPGYTAGVISAVINNGKVSIVKKSLGEYSARPSKKGKAMVSLFAEVNGKRTKMGEMEFRVKEVPPPKAEVKFAANVKGELFIDKMKMVTAGGLSAKLKDFDFKGVRYIITSYKLTGMYKGEQQSDIVKGPKFSKKMEGIVKNTRSGNSITISNIKARRIDTKNTAVKNLDPLVLTIK